MRHYLICSFFAGCLTTIAAPVLAAATSCTGFVSNTTIEGDLVVRDGMFCSLFHVTVTGDVIVQAGATLAIDTLGAPTTIRGNLKASDCRAVLVTADGAAMIVGRDVDARRCGLVSLQTRSTSLFPAILLVGGSLQCKDAVNCGIHMAAVGRDLECSGTLNGCSVALTSIGGSATLNDNASIVFHANSIGGDLTCDGNSVASIVQNVVAGVTSAQCAP